MKKILLFFVIISALYSVEIQVNPEKNISFISPKEISFIKEKFLKQHLKISTEDARTYLKDNRILANMFLQEYSIPKEDYLKWKILIEEELSNLYVRKKEQEKKITDDVIESYYKTHQKDFIEDRKINAVVYRFDDFQKALDFYENKDANMNPKKEEITLITSQIHPVIAPLFEKVSEGQILPPVFFGRDYIVFRIKKIVPSRTKSLEESKEVIKKILYDKIFIKTKKQIIENIEKSGKARGK